MIKSVANICAVKHSNLQAQILFSLSLTYLCVLNCWIDPRILHSAQIHSAKSAIHLRMIQCIKLTDIRTFCMIFSECVCSVIKTCFHSVSHCLIFPIELCIQLNYSFRYKLLHFGLFAIYNFRVVAVSAWKPSRCENTNKNENANAISSKWYNMRAVPIRFTINRINSDRTQWQIRFTVHV